jgi:hypothetical protein
MYKYSLTDQLSAYGDETAHYVFHTKYQIRTDHTQQATANIQFQNSYCTAFCGRQYSDYPDVHTT